VQVLFVHGMGRTSFSGWPLLYRLRRAGYKTNSFGYVVSFEGFDHIRNRLVQKIIALASQGKYVLIGHSLGGILIRAALHMLPPGIRRPEHVFLLGSPIASPRLAGKFVRSPIFRVFTRDCGRLLASEDRMFAIGALSTPVTAIAGVSGLSSKFGPFYGEANDGLVSVSELSAPWLGDLVQIPTIHTLLPCSKRVAEIILSRILASKLNNTSF